MREASKSGESESKDFVFGAAVQSRNEANSAGLVVKTGIYEATRNLATTHSPLYMERAVQLKKNFAREKNSRRQLFAVDLMAE